MSKMFESALNVARDLKVKHNINLIQVYDPLNPDTVNHCYVGADIRYPSQGVFTYTLSNVIDVTDYIKSHHDNVNTVLSVSKMINELDVQKISRSYSQNFNVIVY